MTRSAREEVSDVGPESQPSRPQQRLLLTLLVLSVVSTAIHYSHNYAMAEMYPPVPLFFPTPLSYRVGILVFWPLLTALAVWGYVQYLRGQWTRARVALIVYSPLGITSVGHFLGGVPQIPPFFFATMFTDLATGLAVLVFAIWCVPYRSSRTAARGIAT
jgi:hypothetical protein